MTTKFYDEAPSEYVHGLYQIAKAQFDAERPDLEEQYNMWLGRDAYMQERKRTGKTALSFPMIYIASEAATATTYEILQAHENLRQFSAINQKDILAKIAAERLEDAHQHIFADLEWGSRLMDMVIATSIFNRVYVTLEPQSVPLEPEMGVVVRPELYGTEKLYPSWNVYAPGQVMVLSPFESDEVQQAWFKLRFMSYQQLKREFPNVPKEIIKYKKPLGDVGMFMPSVQSEQLGQSIGHLYTATKASTMQGVEGYLVVEATVDAEFSDGHCEQRVFTYLPEVRDVEASESRSEVDDSHGLMLDERPAPFTSVPRSFRTARARRIPFTAQGLGISQLGIPFQRQFSTQVSIEADMDMNSLAPPTLVRAGAIIGREQPTLDPYAIWTIDDDGKDFPLDYYAKTLPMQPINRAYTSETKQILQNAFDLVTAAVESQTGGQDNSGNPTATVGQLRANGAMRRSMVQFAEHANTMIWITRQHLRMMREAPQEFLYPPIRANSPTFGMAGVLTEQDISQAVRCRVPALSEYAKTEQSKIMWRMVGDGLSQIPLFTQSPELQLWYIERMVRSLRVGEAEVQEAISAAKQGLMQAQMAQAMSAMPVDVGGPTAPPPGGSKVNPAGVTNAGNMTQAMAG